MAVSFEDRRRALIKLLVESSSPVSLDSIQQRLGCSRRTVYYLISKINGEFEEKSLGFIKNKRSRGWYLETEQKRRALDLLSDGEDSHFTALLRPAERLDYLACWLQCPGDPVYVETIMRVFDISRNTVFNDFKRLKPEIEGYDLRLEYDVDDGYSIKGESLSRRAVLMYHLNRLLASIPYTQLHFLDSNRVADYVDRLNDIASIAENGYGRSDLLMIACLLAIVCRLHDAFDCSFLEIDSLKETNEYKLVQQYFPDLNGYEQLYLSVQLLGSRAGRLVQISEGVDDIRLFELAQRMVNQFERMTRCDLIEKDGLVNSLYMHFKLSAYYYRLSIQVINPFADEIRHRYADLYHLVDDICDKNRDSFPFPLLGNEVSYITMHFGGHLRTEEEAVHGEIRVLVVCSSGVATSKLLSREIEQLHSNIVVIAAVSIEEVKRRESEVDFIVSTVPISSEKPWIKVSPLLTGSDRARIASMMALNLKTITPSGSQIDGLFDLLGKYVAPDRMDSLKRDVYAYLQRGNSFIEVGDTHRQGIADVLLPRNIQCESSALSWQDSIRRASAPLLDSGLISDGYVRAMIALVEENGPYIVLCNGVAIAHARASQGARAFCLALLISRKPIVFDEERGVQFLFVLASPEQEAHLHVLKEIMHLAKSPDLLGKLGRQHDGRGAYALLKECAPELARDSESVA